MRISVVSGRNIPKNQIKPVGWISAFFTVLAITSTACQVDVGGPQPPYDPVPVSYEAAESLILTVESANFSDGSGPVALTLNEEQVTSYVAIKLQSQPEPFIYNPQVYLRNNQISIYGRVQKDIMTANACLVLEVRLDDSGNPHLELVSADLGTMPAPEGLLDSASSLLEEAFQFSSFLEEALSAGYKVESIYIANGMITISTSKH